MEKLMQIERDWSQSELVRGDGILERIIADDHLGTEPNGKRATKKELIAENAGPIEMVSNRVQEDDVTIRCYGEVAVHNGSEDWTREDGKSGRYKWTNVLAKRNSRWQVVSSHDLEMPAST